MPPQPDYFEVTRISGPSVRLPNTPEARFLVDSLPRLPPAPIPKNLTVDVADPQWQGKATESALEVAGITGGSYLIVRYIPGPLGKLAAFLFISVAKDPETGRMRPGPPDPLNVAPAPVGFADPEVFGINRDWWIPPGTTKYLPVFVVEHIPGGKDAEAKDRFELALRERERALADLAYGLEIVQDLRSDTLRTIARRDVQAADYWLQFPLLYDWNLAGRSPSALQAAIAIELARRGEDIRFSFGVVEPGNFTAGIQALTTRYGAVSPDAAALDGMFWYDP